MTFGRVAEALPRAIRLVGWPKLVIFLFFFFQSQRTAAPGLLCWAGAARALATANLRFSCDPVKASSSSLSGATLHDTETGELHLPLRLLKSSMTPEDHRSDQVMGSLLPFQRQVQTCGIERLINVQCVEWLSYTL